MKILGASFVLVLAVAACSGGSGGGAAPGGDAGGAGRDATPPQDAPDPADADPADADPSDAAPAACVSDAGAPSADEFGAAPSCSPGVCILATSLDSVSEIEEYVVGTFSFDGTTLDADFGTAGHVHMTLAGQAADAQVVNASGSVVMPKEGPVAGTTFCLGDGSRVQPLSDDTGRQVRFIGRCVESSCGTPAAAAVNGDIRGCCEP